MEKLLRYREVARQIYVDREVVDHAVELADATRRPDRFGLDDLLPLIDYGASPRGPISLVQSAQALALLRGRRYVLASDVRDLAPDVLRHRIVLSYDALSDGVDVEDILDRVLDEVAEPGSESEPAAAASA
jgi:MoxR-like ATPase